MYRELNAVSIGRNRYDRDRESDERKRGEARFPRAAWSVYKGEADRLAAEDHSCPGFTGVTCRSQPCNIYANNPINLAIGSSFGILDTDDVVSPCTREPRILALA